MTRAQRRAIRRTKNRLIRWLEPQPFGPILLPLIRVSWIVAKALVEIAAGLAIGTLALAMLLALPVTLPLIQISLDRDKRRRQQIARSAPCLTCSKLLGERSLELADQAWSQTLEQRNQYQRANPSLKINWGSKTLDAICPHCGQPHQFDPKSRQFVLDPDHSIDQSNPPE